MPGTVHGQMARSNTRQRFSYRVNFQNPGVVCHCHVDQLGQKVSWRRLADQEPYLLKGIGHPREQDEQSDADGANRVEVPHESVANNRHYQTEAIDGNVVAVVDLRYY